MKQVSTTKVGGDDAIDRLLRSQASQIRTGAGDDPCAGFDPDLANAYIEQVLSPTERSNFEAHLAGCSPCRKAVTLLMKVAEPEVAVAAVSQAAPDVGSRRKSVIQGGDRFALKRLFGAMLTPQWAIAAAALVVLAITLPIFLSRSKLMAPVDEIPAKAAVASNARTAQSNSAQSNSAPTNIAPAARLGDGGLAGDVQSTQTEPRSAPKSPGGQAAGTVGGLAAVEEAQPERPVASQVNAETKAQQQGGKEADQLDAPTDALAAGGASKATESAASANGKNQIADEAKSEPKLARIDQRETQRLPQGDSKVEQVAVLKQPRTDGDKREGKDATIRPEDSVPPAPPTTGVEMRARSALRQPAAKLAMRDSSSTESVKPRPREERKISKKKFFLRADFWTDKDYDPLKLMPEVTIVRDSDVYREVMTRQKGLKPYFIGFGEHDRAIIVYRHTVYRLIPQDASK